MKLLNGKPVPDDLSIEELHVMLESSDMQTFALACEALRNRKTNEAYSLLKEYLTEKDTHKYRYILSVIFSYDESSQLQEHFLGAMQSDNMYLVRTVLDHLVHRNIWVSDEQILCCFEKNHNSLDAYYYQILGNLAKTEQHAERLIRLLNTAETDSIRIAVAECLESFSSETNYLRIYALLADSNIAKVRMQACQIANKFSRVDLLQKFTDDPDGHVRKFSICSLENSGNIPR